MKVKIKIAHYLNAALLRRLLILLSIPVFVTSCKTSEKQVSEPDPVKQDSIVIIPADTTRPNYYDPEIQTDYGVIQITPNYDTIHKVTLYGVVVPPKQNH
ncbi:MAG: hypothetical protein A2W93_01800 [Bacteroidetes bacterium GWF2_43_63]|nr:MAG: hypothetical protein A2W94_10275 [Bacteroidetes bacterium GWE2_42_42]OFY55798.1 MAG: hypothetical protein A2W93_01800 [Bacteroidetes bacterium GWF2_43_63]HBG71282.1 hypothetical protein [Bacteroidales bacterium]HCB60497.1 hypothetical protein [Bacteroidales bacterium]HCY22546.1 hypothetical protein [Bacteroidales bacterium]